MELVLKIEKLCKNQGISIAELERKIGIGNGIIRRWNKSYPSYENLVKVSDYFGVTLDYLTNSFEKKLKELRTNKNVVQKDLAEYIGVSTGMISRYESGDKLPSIETIEKIAEYFGVTIDYLLGNNNTLSDLEEQFPEGVHVLRRATKELTPEARAKMVKLMKAFLEEE